VQPLFREFENFFFRPKTPENREFLRRLAKRLAKRYKKMSKSTRPSALPSAKKRPIPLKTKR
tara:strand:- start:11 stop:196 length:186 start_codon:yes stop_codon:yes gene_type:complete